MAGTIQAVNPALWDARVDVLPPRTKLKFAMEGASAIPLAIGATDAATELNRQATRF
jgi:hypothetical protein